MSDFKKEGNHHLNHHQFQTPPFLGIFNISDQQSLFAPFPPFSPSLFKTNLSHNNADIQQSLQTIESTNFHQPYLNFQQFSNFLPQFSQSINTNFKLNTENDPMKFLFNSDIFKLPKPSKNASSSHPITSQSSANQQKLSNLDLEKSLIYQ